MTIKGLIWLVVLLVVAVGIALAGGYDQGHATLLYPPYRVDMSLHMLFASIVITFVVLYIIIRVISTLVTMPSRVGRFRARSRTAKAHAALRDALANLYAGRFSRAEKSARVAANVKDNRDSAGLIGALAAHRMRETARRDTWLDTMSGAQWQDAKLMTLAEMQVDAHESEAALVSLNALETQGARRLRALQISLRAHKEQKNWDEVLRIVKILEKREAITPASATRVKQQAADHLLRERRHDADALLTCWRGLPASARLLPRTADLAAELLLALDRPADACRIIEQALAEQWDPRLIQRYGACGGKDPLPLIQRAETWQAAHPDDADLSFALGALCIQQRLWGKAQSFLETALKQADHPSLKARTHLALARMFDGIGNIAQANAHYRESALAIDSH